MGKMMIKGMWLCVCLGLASPSWGAPTIQTVFDFTDNPKGTLLHEAGSNMGTWVELAGHRIEYGPGGSFSVNSPTPAYMPRVHHKTYSPSAWLGMSSYYSEPNPAQLNLDPGEFLALSFFPIGKTLKLKSILFKFLGNNKEKLDLYTFNAVDPESQPAIAYPWNPHGGGWSYLLTAGGVRGGGNDLLTFDRKIGSILGVTPSPKSHNQRAKFAVQKVSVSYTPMIINPLPSAAWMGLGLMAAAAAVGLQRRRRSQAFGV